MSSVQVIIILSRLSCQGYHRHHDVDDLHHQHVSSSSLDCPLPHLGTRAVHRIPYQSHPDIAAKAIQAASHFIWYHCQELCMHSVNIDHQSNKAEEAGRRTGIM